MTETQEHFRSRRDRWREIIFEAETPAGRRFDVIIPWLIGLSITVVMILPPVRGTDGVKIPANRPPRTASSIRRAYPRRFPCQMLGRQVDKGGAA